MKYFRHLVIMLMTAILVSATVVQTYYINADNVNLRSKPNTDAPILAKLSKGTEVDLQKYEGSWAKIKVNSIEGYVAKQFLTLEKPAATPQKTETKKKEVKVLICLGKTAYAYHSGYCSGLNRCRSGVSEVTKSQALAYGRTPCKICY